MVSPSPDTNNNNNNNNNTSHTSNGKHKNEIKIYIDAFYNNDFLDDYFNRRG
jgi:hypothetical protein